MSLKLSAALVSTPSLWTHFSEEREQRNLVELFVSRIQKFSAPAGLQENPNVLQYDGAAELKLQAK